MAKDSPIDRILESRGTTTTTTITYRNKMWQVVDFMTLKLNLKLISMRKIVNPDNKNDVSYAIHLSGGNNGNPNWVAYCLALATFFNKIGEEYNAWLLNIDNDAPDDVFEAYIVFRNK